MRTHRLAGRLEKYRGTTVLAKGRAVWSGEVKLWEPHLNKPLKNQKPTVYFVNSMSDLFHSDLPFEDLMRVFEVMNNGHWHRFQVLTKRDQYLAEVASELKWTANIHMGVSVEDAKRTSRIDHLRKVPAAVRFLSVEPLLEAIPSLDLQGIHWVIAGGESGPRARPMEIEWVRDIVEQCRQAKVPVFVKQLGKRPTLAGVPYKVTGKGGDMDEWPPDLRIREQPNDRGAVTAGSKSPKMIEAGRKAAQTRRQRDAEQGGRGFTRYRRKSWGRIEFDCPEPVDETILREKLTEFLEGRFTIRGRWARYDPVGQGLQDRPHTHGILLYLEHAGDSERLVRLGHLTIHGQRVVFRRWTPENRMTKAALRARETRRKKV